MKKYIALLIVLIFAITGWAFPPIPPTNMASPGAIGGTTPAAGTFTTLNADHIGENTGSHGVVIDNNVDVGSTTAGKNVTINSSLPTEMAPALEAANWTATDGWSAGSGVLTKVAGTGTGTATPSGTFTVTAGRRYQVTIVCSAVSGTLTYTLGGVTGTTITATTITDNIIAATTDKIIFSGGAAVTTTITSISVKEATPSTGDLTVGGKTTFKNGITLPFGGYASNPLIRLGNEQFGFYLGEPGELHISSGATVASVASRLKLWWAGTAIYQPLYLGTNSTVVLREDASNTLGIYNSTTQQVFRLYNTWTNSSNYERLTLTGVQGASVNITAETAGTGGDNLDVVLTPAGTGQLKNTASAITSGSGTGVTVNHTGAVIQQVYKVTTTYAAYSDSDLTKGIVIATLPAKTRLIAAYADTTVAYAGTSITAATLEIGVTAEGAAEIIATHDVFAGVTTKGLADADMGTGMTRAAQIQGAYTPSFTGTTAVYATIDATTGAATTLANLTAGSTTFYLITEKLP